MITLLDPYELNRLLDPHIQSFKFVQWFKKDERKPVREEVVIWHVFADVLVHQDSLRR
jgi:hypothetical protein